MKPELFLRSDRARKTKDPRAVARGLHFVSEGHFVQLEAKENTAVLGLEYKRHFTTNQRKKINSEIIQTVKKLPIRFDGSVPLAGKLKDLLKFLNVHKDLSHATTVLIVSGLTSVDDPIKDELQDKFDKFVPTKFPEDSDSEGGGQ